MHFYQKPSDSSACRQLYKHYRNYLDHPGRSRCNSEQLRII